MEARTRTLLVYAACLLMGGLAALMVALTVGAGEAPGAERSVTLVGAGDIADCDLRTDEATAKLVKNIQGTVFTTGDNVYDNGTRREWKECYDPSWGDFKKRTRPSAGNHDYYTDNAQPYYDYFGARAGGPRKGYYSYDRGAWHIVVLNSNCEKVSCAADSPQAEWLRNDLAANRTACTLAYWHHPRYASGTSVQTASVDPFWQILYNRGAELVLNGHAHRYERHRPLKPVGDQGELDPDQGIQQFIVGTGGKPPLGDIGTTDRHSVVKNDNTPGVLRLSLRSDSYSFKFVPVAGKNFTDAGTRSCH
jgi:acid phosphatase type 7